MVVNIEFDSEEMELSDIDELEEAEEDDSDTEVSDGLKCMLSVLCVVL